MTHRKLFTRSGLLRAALVLLAIFTAMTVTPGRNALPAAQAQAAAAGDAAGTPEPTYIFDFTDDSTYTLGPETACVVEETDTGFRIEVLGDDPNLTIGSLLAPGNECAWIKIRYRGGSTVKNRQGEMYISTADKEFSEKTRVNFKWGTLGEEWQTNITNSKMLSRLEDEILAVRFDPLSAGSSGPLQEGEWIEISYIAFFGSKEAAEAFDYDAYAEALNNVPTVTPGGSGQPSGEKWGVPEKRERYVIGADNEKGTLGLVSDAAAGTLTVSYGEGGERKEFVVPDTAYFRNGPLSGTDALGRSLPGANTVIDPDYIIHDENGNPSVYDAQKRAVGVYGENGKRYVGLFYFLWHGTFQGIGKEPRNIQNLLDAYGEKAADMPELWGDVYSIFYFAKPLYGYYSSDDEWVIRKHLELLTNAGIDFLYFDVTNNYLYAKTALKIMRICQELNEQGYGAPKVVFYTNTNAAERVKQAYEQIYSKNLYPDTWMMLDGKPLIIAPYSANVDNFFTIRLPQWPNEDQKENSWPWIDFDWPQKDHGVEFREAISVSVAQHSGNVRFSSSVLYGYRNNRGRSYDGYRDAPTADSYKNGANLQLQFNRAIDSGMPYVLVTGWNEWVASRQEPVSRENIVFVDTFNLEYSRDIEMSEGAYGDNYYMQLMSNTAAVRGAAPEIVRDDRHAVDIAGDFGQWDAVAHYYADTAGDAAPRKSVGAGTFSYNDETGRNDIVRIKVTGDASYLYFYAECSADIARGSGSDGWMQLFLNADNAPTGWEGYDYIVCRRTKDDNTATLAAASPDGTYSFTDIADLTYRVEGNKMMIAVPLELIGIDYFNMIDLSFKWTDSRSEITDPVQFYTDGDCAPLGRPDFTYRTYPEGAAPQELLSTVKLADRKTAYEKEQSGLDPVERKIENNGSGLPGWAVAAFIAAGIVVICTAAFIFIRGSKRKKRKEGKS